MSSDTGLATKIVATSKAREHRYLQILGREERNNELTVRYMAQYAALGSLLREHHDGSVILNYDTPNLPHFNIGLYSGLSRPNSSDAEAIPGAGVVCKEGVRMKIVYFLRSAPYDYLIEGFDLYDSFDLVARKKADPDINPTTIRIRIPNVSVFCAPDKRCFSTAKLICNEPKRLGLLSEIGYSMAEIMPKSEFFGIDGKPDVTKAKAISSKP